MNLAKYLGSVLHCNGLADADVIDKASQTFGNSRNIFFRIDISLSVSTKHAVYQAVVYWELCFMNQKRGQQSGPLLKSWKSKPLSPGNLWH